MKRPLLIAAAMALIAAAAPAAAQCLDRFGCARLSDDPMSSYRPPALKGPRLPAPQTHVDEHRLPPPTYWPPSQRGLAPSYQGYGPSYPGYVR